MKEIVKIGIIGDYDGRKSHIATDHALEHAGTRLGLQVDIKWIPTEDLLDKPEQILNGYDGLWCSPGSPYKSMTGALNGISYARTNNIPFIGTCGGFQHGVLEYARDVLDIKELRSDSFDPYQPNDYITPLSCSLVGQTKDILLLPDSYMAKIYQQTITSEKFNCSFGLSDEFCKKLTQNGYEIQGFDEEKNPRILILRNQGFFVLTLFQPQLNSSTEKPHPLISEYLRNCSQ